VGAAVSTPYMSFDDIDDGPRHEAELMAGYRPDPSIAHQSATHGAPLPAADDGPDPGSVTG